MVVLRLCFARQLTQALLQVARRGDCDDSLGVRGRPLAKGLPLIELGERGLGVMEVTVEQRGGLGDVAETTARLGGLR